MKILNLFKARGKGPFVGGGVDDMLRYDHCTIHTPEKVVDGITEVILEYAEGKVPTKDRYHSFVWGISKYNPHRISMKRWMEENGYENLEDAQDTLQDSVMPALCDEGCEVEPDGKCPHGCPSPLIAMGII